MGHCEDSVMVYTKLINAQQSAGYYAKRAYYQFACNNLEAAINDCDTCIDIDAQNGECYRLRSMCQVRRSRYWNAKNDGIKCVERDSTNSDAWQVLGVAYMEAKDYGKAMAAFNRSIAINPKNYVTYLNRAFCFAFQGEFKKAFADLEVCLLADPNSARAYDYRGSIYIIKDDFKRGLKDIEKAFELDPKRKAMSFDKAYCLQMLGYREEAIQWYGYAIKYDPEDSEAYYWRGRAYESIYKHDEAAADFTSATLLGHDVAKTRLKENYPVQWDEYKAMKK